MATFGLLWGGKNTDGLESNITETNDTLVRAYRLKRDRMKKQGKKMENIFFWPEGPENEERSETLGEGLNGLKIERISSSGQSSPPGFWYDQNEDEWVVLLEGEARIQYATGIEHHLRKGDHLLLPKHVRHRVSWTSSRCLWLAVYADGLSLPSKKENDVKGNKTNESSQKKTFEGLSCLGRDGAI